MVSSCSGLVSARHTFGTFVFRYRENGGRRVDYDLVQNLVHVPAAVETKDPFARDPRMERLDPNEWKRQDHYVVLGLEDKRGDLCTAEDVRNAYRSRVLSYHPDKIAQRMGKGKGRNQKDDAIFKCIQKAFEVMTDPDRKAAFDSVDPTFSDIIPGDKLPANADFYEVFGPVFEHNVRFSKKKTILVLGNGDSPREQVEAFYQFWFDFDSVRRFDYLDEDDCETGGENRADKRWQEKKNKAARAKRKTEDNARVRRLTENAYKLDPRVKAHKEADKQAKLDRKQTGKNGLVKPGTAGSAATAAALQAKQAEEKAQAEAVAAVQTAAVAEAKKVKEAEATALRKERKALKTLFADNNYFLPPGLDAAARLKHLEEEAMLLEQVCQKMSTMELGSIRGEIEREAATRAPTNILRERLGVAQVERCVSPVPVTVKAAKPVAVVAEAKLEWSLHDIDLLINGAKKFPGGTRSRWETIADWFNRTAQVQRSVDEILRKSDELVKSSGAAAAVGGMASGNISLHTDSKRDPRIDQNEPTLANPGAAAGPAPWTSEEQAQLEQAMKSIPVSQVERWDAIATLIPTRSKKECMLRAKDLAALLKASK